MPIQAVIFDFDGLIIDTEGAIFAGWQEIYQSYGVELPLDIWRSSVGHIDAFDSYDYLEQATGRMIDRDALDATWQPRITELCEQLEPLPGVLDRIAEAKRLGLGCGIASSSDRAWVHGWLNRLSLRQHFTCILTRDDVLRVKPDPELYLRAADCLGTYPEQCIVFEDSVPGMSAALAAGMRCVGVPGLLTLVPDLPAIDLRLGSLADTTLEELIARFA